MQKGSQQRRTESSLQASILNSMVNWVTTQYQNLPDGRLVQGNPEFGMRKIFALMESKILGFGIQEYNYSSKKILKSHLSLEQRI